MSLIQKNPPAPILSNLRVEGLRKRVGDFTLKADFTLKKCERVALLGKSGSGKTSLLRVLAGLDPFDDPLDQGRVFIGDLEITRLSPQKRNIGYVFQEQALFSSLNVLDNLTFGLRMRGVPRKERDDLAIFWLDKLNLQSKRHSLVGQLSGGEKQRIAFIRALIWSPQLILLDEPFSALDFELRARLREELIQLHELWPAPLLLVTHDESDIVSLATRRLKLEWNENSVYRTVHP